MRAVSSPTTYAPAPQWSTMSTLKFVPRMFLPMYPAAYASLSAWPTRSWASGISPRM